MLKRRALKATLWSGADVLLRQGLQFVITIVLARLVGPADFGTVATLALFVGMATVLMDGGFSAALLQSRDIDHTDESTVFWFNLVIGALLSGILAAASPAIAKFYGMPALRELTPVLGLTVFIASLGTIHATLINKRLEFDTLIRVNLVAVLASGTVAIILALHRYGIWALAAQALVMAVVTTAMLWFVDAWRPAWIFSRKSAHKLFAFSSYQLASSLLDAAYNRFYTLILGRWFGASELGYYGNAENMRQMPARFLSAVLLRAAFPMFAQAAHNPKTLRRGLQLSIRGTMLLNAPAMLGAAALADPLVRFLFGSSWAPAAPVLVVLCIAGALYPVQALNVQALMAQGHARLVFGTSVVKVVVGLAFTLAGAWFGMLGIAWSQVAAALFALYVNTFYTAKLLGYGMGAQARDFLPSVLIAALMGVSVSMLERFWQWPGHATLRLAVLVGMGATFFFAIAVLLRIHALRDVALLVRGNPRAEVEKASTL